MASNNNICDKNTKIADLHPEIMATHILTRIDPTSLASTAQASSQLHAICNNEMVWTELCNSTWHSTKHQLVRKAISSFPAGHRSFFSDSFPILHFSKDNKYWHYNTTPVQMSEQLISAVDIQYKAKKVYTKVDVINTGSEYLGSSSFKVEVLDQKESLRLPMKCDDEEDVNFADLKENMTLSWIVIDPTQRRAANISSQLPVSVRRHWIDGDIEVKYAIVMPRDTYAGMSEMVEMRIIVMLEWEEGKKYLKLRKVKLQVHDMDGVCLGGEESLRILQEAIHCGTRKKAKRGEVTEMYKKYVEKKRRRREGRLKGRQSQLTAAFITGVLVALIILMILKVGILW